MKLHTPEELKARIDEEVGVSEWMLITQDMVDRFADLTDDHQFIHVDPVLAAKTPFGGTIAHGFLILSLMAKFGQSADFILRDVQMGMNYGFDKVRLMAPVKTGKRIRGRFILKSLIEKSPNQWLSTLSVTIEIEGETKPAIVAEWLGMQFTKAKEVEKV
jgi:acyl dehydratase